MATDYYELLGVSRDAPPEEIKRAYRKLARQLHPDANPDDPGAEARFKEVALAYEVLSDPEKKQRYDMFGDTGMGSPDAGGGFGAGGLFLKPGQDCEKPLQQSLVSHQLPDDPPGLYGARLRSRIQFHPCDLPQRGRE